MLMNGNLDLSFCMNFLKFSNQIGRALREIKHHVACDCAPLVPNKFEVIWTNAIGELMDHQYLIGVEWHDRLTSYLNYVRELIGQ